jgi:HEAT repeat protein
LALGAIGRPAVGAVPVLKGALDDDDLVVPPGAALALGQLGPEAESAVPALCKALSAPSYELRAQALSALVAIGPASVPSLRETLNSKDPSVLVLAAQALVRIGPKARSAIPELLIAFDNEDLNVKATTAAALAVFEARSPNAIPALSLAVGNSDVNVATAAVTLLQELKAGTPLALTAFIARLEVGQNADAGAMELDKLIVRSLGQLGQIARPAVPVLITTLDMPDLLDETTQALRTILGSDAKGAELVKVLKDQEQLDDRQIALVLGSADGEAVPALIELLGHKNVRVRAAAELSLGRLNPKSRESQPSLINLLEDGNRQVRLNAIRVLTQQNTGPTDEEKTQKGVLDALEKSLAHWDEVTRVEAALRIAQEAGKKSSPVTALQKMQLPARELIGSLKKESDPVRQQTLIDALNGLASIRIELQLPQGMRVDDILARERIALALGQITTAQDNEAAVASLVQAMGDRHVALRLQSIRSLGRLAQAGTIDRKSTLQKAILPLEFALHDRDHAIRQAAAIAIWRITDQTDKALPILLQELEFLSFEDGEIIEKLRSGELGIPTLIELVSMAEQHESAKKALAAALKHEDEHVRAGVAAVVGSMTKPQAREFAQSLSDALVDPNFATRLQATVAFRWLEFGEQQQEQVIPRLERLLEDRHREVRIQSLITLGYLAPRSGIAKLDRLEESLKDRDGSIRARAAEALGRFGPRAAKAVPDLRRAVKDQDTAVRRLAIASLGQIGAASLPALKAALGDKDFDVRKLAVVALGRMGIAAHGALPALRDALSDKDQEVAAAAAEALKNVERGETR